MSDIDFGVWLLAGCLFAVVSGFAAVYTVLRNMERGMEAIWCKLDDMYEGTARRRIPAREAGECARAESDDGRDGENESADENGSKDKSGGAGKACRNKGGNGDKR